MASDRESCPVLEIVISNFTQPVGTTFENDAIRAKSVEMSMSVEVTLRNPVTGEVYIDKCRFCDSVECYVGSRFEQTRYQSMTHLTKKLAQRICRAVCVTW